MKNIGKKTVAILGVVSILGTGAIAAGTDIKGKIAQMNVFNNGAAVTLPADQKPIIVNDRYYLPIRAVSEALGKEVDWNVSEPNNVYITGGADEAQFNQMAVELNQAKLQIVDKDKKIVELEKKVKELEDAKKEEDKGVSLSELEKDLQKEYGRYEGVYLDVYLSGNKDKVKVDVTISKSYRTDWDDLTTSRREKLVDNIVYDIQREYKDAKIEGYVDSGYSSTSIDFYTDNRGKLVIRGGSSNTGKYLSSTEMERFIEDEYRKDVEKAYIEVKGYKVNVEIDIYDNLSNGQIEDLVEDIKFDIVDNLKDTVKSDITIEVYYKNNRKGSF